ncbi:hypothetical protein RB195_018729 [Necator americanus]|uniref:Cyclopropane-fatty-acyl-phospholipid synthase n=1 Tax=Necator americanus TaxID=51031 RepID=A0ABR1CCB6_NECAM
MPLEGPHLFGYTLLVQFVCIPFISRFLDAIVGKSSEKLKLSMAFTGEELNFGGGKVENNNEAAQRREKQEAAPSEELEQFDFRMDAESSSSSDHYDLGNDMFRMFLDPSMTYSCALFPEPLEPVEQVNFEALEQAQIRKIDVLTDMLDLRPSDSVLEIGCGWGAFAVRAVKVGMNMIGKEGQSRQSHEYQLLQRKQCNWTGLTISNEQLQWAKRKVIEEDLEEKICLKYKDYRLAKGQYNKLVSIEMIEAVGQKFLTQYFRVLSDRLIPGGIAVLQGIVCPDAYYDHYCNSSDFIKKYIFPGGHMPSIGAIKSSLPGNLKIAEMKHIGRHYAVTLDHWYRYEFGQRIDKSQTIDITPSETVK